VNIKPTPRHLSHDALLIALVDRDDLDTRQAAHLKECPACQKELDRLALRYNRMGKLAAGLAPEPTKKIRLPQRVSSASPYRLRPLMALGAAAAMVLLITTFWPWTVAEIPAPSSPVMVIPDRQLMQEIHALVDNALPPAIKRLAAVATPQFDEDLINWIVPSIEEEGDLL
jgi:hypothetical protein